MLKKYTLLLLLFSNFVLPMGNDSAQVIEKNGMSKTKKVMIGCGIGVVVIGGAIVLSPVVLPTATLASIKAACAAATAQATAVGVSAKAAVASAAAHSSAGVTLKVLTAGAGALGLTAASKQPAEKHVYRVEKDSHELREIKTSTPSRVGLVDVIVAVNFSRDVLEAVGDGVKKTRDIIEGQSVKSEQEKTLEELEKEKAQRKSLAESIALAYQ